MNSYKMVQLGTLIHQAKTVRCGNGDYPVLSMTMHDGLVFQENKFKKVVASKDRSDYKVVKRNQLVISFPIDEGVLATQRIVDAGIVSPAYGIWDIDQEKILPEFLEYSLRCERALSYYKAKLRGSTARRRSLPTPTLLAFLVPLPSIDEQVYILKVMHVMNNIILNYSTKLEKLDDLVKARFVELFGDPIINSKNLPIEKMEKRYFLKAGITTSAENIYEYSTEKYEVPCYGGNGIRGYVKDSSYEGEYPIIGRQGALCGNVQYASGKFHATEHAVLVSMIKEDNTIWVYYMLKLMDLYRYHTGAAQPGLAVKTLNTVNVIVANKELQEEFADFVSQVNKSKVAVQQALDKAQLLFDSLMQQYFG